MQNRVTREAFQDAEKSSPHQPRHPSDSDLILLNSSDLHEIAEPVVSNDPSKIAAPPSEADIPKSNPRTLLTIIAGLLALGFGTYVTWLMLQPEPDFDAMPSSFSEEAERQDNAQ